MCVNIYNMDPACPVRGCLSVSQQMGCNLIWAEGGRVTPDSQPLSRAWLRPWWQMIVPLLIRAGEWVRAEREKVGRMADFAPCCLMTHPLFLSLKWFWMAPLPPHPAQQSPYSRVPSVHGTLIGVFTALSGSWARSGREDGKFPFEGCVICENKLKWPS